MLDDHELLINVNTYWLVRLTVAKAKFNSKSLTSKCNIFWVTVTVCKMVHPMLSDHCLSCSVCLWRWCIVAKRLDGLRWHLACR